MRLALLLVAALTSTALLLGPAAADEDRGGREPGLPFIPCVEYDGNQCSLGPTTADDFGWINFAQSGLAGAKRAKQWARVPVGIVASNNTFTSDSGPGGNDNRVYSQAFLVSPSGSKHNYGDSVLIHVRTVAFGSIPAEVTVQLSQRRDERDLPIPIKVTSRNTVQGYPDTSTLSRVYPTRIADILNVRVRKIVVDGRDLGLGPDCQTGPAARLDVVSRQADVYAEPGYSGGISKQDDTFDPADVTNGHLGLYGGTFEGSIDVPKFSGCRTRTGDDVSRLLTATISGTANPVSLRLGSLSCTTYDAETSRPEPTSPGNDTPTKAHCTEEAYPYNPKITILPKPFAFPSTAP